MATSDRRGLLLRSLPVLVLLTLLLATAPQRSTSRPQAAVSTSAIAQISSTAEDPATEAAATDDPPADHVTVLADQSTASARGSRAPPFASV
ncbi:hypothetical protein ACQP2Y_17580 [Actinoplanes sp. CA-051413]|uniref:hypothetical protein n=1 Tax=Actinoplanes sp. CA-051413 TaxID=3239899 RepID=UPI003D9515A5